MHVASSFLRFDGRRLGVGIRCPRNLASFLGLSHRKHLWRTWSRLCFSHLPWIALEQKLFRDGLFRVQLVFVGEKDFLGRWDSNPRFASPLSTGQPRYQFPQSRLSDITLYRTLSTNTQTKEAPPICQSHRPFSNAKCRSTLQ